MSKPLDIVSPFLPEKSSLKEHSIKKYYPCPKLIEVFTDVALHAILVVVALTLIFQEKLSKTEHRVLTSEFEHITELVTDVASSKASQLGSCSLKMLMKYVMNTTKAMQRDDTATHNKCLKADNMFGTFGALTMIVIAMVITAVIQLRYRHCRAADSNSCHSDEIEWSHIFTNNVVCLITIGLFETYFVFNIASHYIPTSRKEVKLTMLDRIDEDLDIVERSDSAFVAPPLKSTHETFGTLSASFAFASVVSIVCIFALSKMKRKHYCNASMGCTPDDGKALSWLWEGETNRSSKARSTQEYVFDITRNRLILPIVGTCGMFAGITFTYFTKISQSEQWVNDRQAQRVVDQAMFTFNATMANFTKEEKRELIESIREPILAERSEVSKEKIEDEDIQKYNATLIDKTYRLGMVSGSACVGLVALGTAMTFFNDRHGKRPYQHTLKYVVMSVITFILGSSVAFLCEYGFLNAVLANYDAVSPASVMIDAIDKFNEKLDTEECDALF